LGSPPGCGEIFFLGYIFLNGGFSTMLFF
jgi:hypothetical protein